jgi:hypothetical protein
MTINLVWERRQEHVSRALERQVDDALPYLTVSRKSAGVSPGAATSAGQRPSASLTAAPRATGSATTGAATGDAIEIPPVGGASAGSSAGSIQGPLGPPPQASATPATARAAQPARASLPTAHLAVAPTVLAKPASRPSPARSQPAAAGRMTLRPLARQSITPSPSEPPVDLNPPVDLQPNPASPADPGAPVDLAGPPAFDRPVDLVPPAKPRRTR